MFTRRHILIPAVLIASTALAHDGVMNPAVKARMDAMSTIGQNMKTLGKMAKGQTGFDTAAAHTALIAIADQADHIPTLFEAQEDDAKSEAAPEIWSNWDDFSAKAQALQSAARSGAGLSDIAGLGTVFGAVGQTCKACHEAYKF